MFLVSFLASLALSPSSLAAAPSPIAVKDPVAGLSQPELAKRWWQWAASFPERESPISDRSGARCSAGQQGDVWFLAGVFGSDPAQRTCHVPAGKTLFFPVINYIVMPNDSTSGCAESIKSAREMTDSPSEIYAELDGEKVADVDKHRVASSGCFNAGERLPGHPETGPAATNGYWLAFAPLSKGRHKLRFGGTLPTLHQDLSYTLIVD